MATGSTDIVITIGEYIVRMAINIVIKFTMRSAVCLTMMLRMSFAAMIRFSTNFAVLVIVYTITSTSDMFLVCIFHFVAILTDRLLGILFDN